MNDTPKIPTRWLLPVRILTAVSVLASLIFFFVAVPARMQQLQTICNHPACDEPFVLHPEDLSALEELGISTFVYAAFHTGVEVVSTLVIMGLISVLFWRASDTWMGIITIGALVNLSVFVGMVQVPLYDTLFGTIMVSIFGSLSTGSFFLLIFVFPTGQFRPAWIAKIVFPLLLFAVIIRCLTSPGDTPWLPGAEFLIPFFFFLYILLLLTAIILQIIRYRRFYTYQERLQTRWLIFSLFGFVSGIGLWFIMDRGFVPVGPQRVLFGFFADTWMTIIGLMLIPVALTIAILRYRLWDIDVIIRRTVQYSLVTGILALTYFGGIVILQGILGPLTGDTNSPVVTVITTLGIAALFNPLRTRVQDFIDRRFYRKKYNAEQALAQFAAAARDEVDIEKLTAALLGVVEEAMQPRKISFWLREGERTSRE
jgi:hypothetical protein